MKSMTLVAMVAGVLAAGAAVGQTFDPNRGLFAYGTVVVDGKTNVIEKANLVALRNMSWPERAKQWSYLDKVNEHRVEGGLEIRRIKLVNLMSGSDAAFTPIYVPAVSAVRILVAGEHMPPWDVLTYKEIAKKFAIENARKKLFLEGKSFVVKNGVNPLSPLVDPVITALNAPACTGLIEALAAIGVTDLTDGGKLPEFTPPDAKKIAEMTEAAKTTVVTGASTDPGWQGQLLVLLGVDGYNAFVKQFNEGK